jgi:hypothetical protein
MTAYLGPRSAMGLTNLVNPLGAGFWTVAFTPAVFSISVPFEVYHAAVSGPANSNFQVWIDSTFYDYAVRGDINSWDPAQPMVIQPGNTLYYYWNTASSPTPNVTVFCRETSAF